MSDEEIQYGQIFTQVVSETAGVTMGQITGGEWKNEFAQDEPPEGGAEVRFEISGARVNGEFSFHVNPLDAILAARLFVGDDQPPAEDAEPSDDEKEALDELLRQIAGAAATALRPHFGKIELRFMGRDSAEWQRAECWRFTLSDGSHQINFHVNLSSDMLLVAPEQSEQPAIPAPRPEDQQPEEQVASQTAPAPSAASGPADSFAAPTPTTPPAVGNLAVPVNGRESFSTRRVQELMRDGNLDVLLDIEMNVTLRFGRRVMLIKDILELASGSVIEMDRTITEPVDLVIDNKVIAHGEVIIVNGNYGLRVTDVASAQQKIEMLQ